MQIFTAQERTGPMLISNRAITIPACGDLPFFFGNRHSLGNGILLSNINDTFYRLSNYELHQIRKAFLANSKAIVTAPFEADNCDNWFLRLEMNKIFVTEGHVLSSETARILLNFGGVMDKQGDFTFKTIAKANEATNYIFARRKLDRKVSAKNSLKNFLNEDDIHDKSILIVNPSDFVMSEMEDLSTSNMVDFVEPSGTIANQLVNKGAVFKGNSIYELTIKHKYDFIVFAGDSKDVDELVRCSVLHLRASGNMAFIAPVGYRAKCDRFTQRLISLTTECTKQLSSDTEVTTINRDLISDSQLQLLLRAS